ncbi:hypothetical protein ACHMW5_04145 [Azospirillum melinis]|uniref:hypothetical protein n=1 Tax=Azospirillum melinis TaxID=328839 RepID=UPI0037579276
MDQEVQTKFHLERLEPEWPCRGCGRTPEQVIRLPKGGGQVLKYVDHHCHSDAAIEGYVSRFPGTTVAMRDEVDTLLSAESMSLARASDRVIEQGCATDFQETCLDRDGRRAVGQTSEVVGGWNVVAVFPASVAVILESEPGYAEMTVQKELAANTARRACELVDRHADDATGLGDVIAAIGLVRAVLPSDMPAEVAALFGMSTETDLRSSAGCTLSQSLMGKMTSPCSGDAMTLPVRSIPSVASAARERPQPPPRRGAARSEVRTRGTATGRTG